MKILCEQNNDKNLIVKVNRYNDLMANMFFNTHFH